MNEGSETSGRTSGWRRGTYVLVMALLGVVAVVTYLPFADLPPMIDDYGHVEMAERLGMPAGWGELANDPLSRCRATALVLTALTYETFGFSVAAWNWTGIVLHVVNVWLVFLLGECRYIGWRVSAAAALVFAARERHHEAVIWYAAVHELLVFFFVLACLLMWIRWLEGGSRWWWVAVGLSWALALLSKESAAALTFLLPALALLYPGRRRAAVIVLATGLVVTGAYFLAGYLRRSEHLHFNDGTFALGWHAAPNFLRSAARALAGWGVVGLLLLVWRRREVSGRLAWLALAWTAFGLASYVFLTYMPTIPSRHHYLASAGVALLTAYGFLTGLDGMKRPKLTGGILVAVYLLHNWLYLWSYKLPHMEERAQVAEAFLNMVKEDPRTPVRIRCRLLPWWEAKAALHYRLGLKAEEVIVTEEGREAREYDCEEGAWRRRVWWPFQRKGG